MAHNGLNGGVVEIRINQRLELIFSGRRHVVRVEDVEGTRIWITAPLEAGRVISFPTRAQVTGRLLDARGVLEFAGQIMGRQDGTLVMLAVEVTGAFARTERRCASRHPCLDRVTVTFPDLPRGRPCDGRLLDLSHGGARLRVVSPWPDPAPGQRAGVTTYHRKPPVSMDGEIVWTQPIPARSGRQILLGLQWALTARAGARCLVMTVTGLIGGEG